MKTVVSFFTVGGGQHEDHILAWYYGFNANISFTFQAVKNLSQPNKAIPFNQVHRPVWGITANRI